MITAVPFIETMLNEEYLEIVQQKFNTNLLSELFNNIHFQDMVGWTKVSVDGYTIEIFDDEDYYKIKNHSNDGMDVFVLPYPKTLEDFICDCYRCSVILQWNFEISLSSKRFQYMNREILEVYNKELLAKIEKS